MILYPAIDLLGGRVVRLMHGRFDQVTEYGDNPAAVAARFAAAGSEWVHVVDLDGARDGSRRQTDAILSIREAGLKIQSGGGGRSSEDVAALLDAGVNRVVIGSMAIKQPETVMGWLDAFGPETFLLAFDVQYQNGAYRPAVQGWTDVLTVTLDDVLALYADAPLRHAMATDISRDGALSGANTELYTDLVRRYPDYQWQASGGIASLDDLEAVRKTGVAGVISGRAIYEGAFTLEEALACSLDA